MSTKIYDAFISDEYKEQFKNKTTEIESLINTDITNVIDALKL